MEEPKLKKTDGGIEIKNDAATKGEVTLSPGSICAITMEGIDRPVLFTGNKNAVAFADDSGVIHARSKGKAKLTATVNKVKFTVNVKVE